jgi:outer membrane protein assembly factor BamB
VYLQSCVNDNPPDIQYSKGDFWLDNFRNNSFPSKAFKDDKIYCSSISIGANMSNYLYSLNLKTGTVDWATPVNNWASQPPIIGDSFIYYCSYVGDIYKFDRNGNQLWLSEFNTTYGGHCINPLNNNLIVSTVAYGLREIDFQTGNVIDSIGYGKGYVPLPIFQNDTIYQVIVDTLFCTKNMTGSVLWKRKIGTNVRRLFINQNRLYFFDDTKTLNCIDTKTGNMVWQSEAIFDKDPLNPRLLFEQGKAICYFSSLNHMFLLDAENGNFLEKAAFENLQKGGFLIPEISKYNVLKDGKSQYCVKVENSLFGSKDFKSSYDVLVQNDICR